MKQIEALIEEGLTSGGIAQRLGRSEAEIRNLRYRKGLVRKAEDEAKVLFHQRDALRNVVKSLQDQHRTLTSSVALLKAEKDRLESIIGLDRSLLQVALTQGLTNLKYQRPDLFTLSGIEQIALLARRLSDQLTH